MSPTNKKMTTTFNFTDYAEDTVASNKLPYCQMLSSKEKDRPFGFFIPMKEAIAANFIGFDGMGWEEHTSYFVTDGIEKEETGFITSRLQGKLKRDFTSDWINLICVRSTKILAFGPNNYGKVAPLGLYYNQTGELTEHGLNVEQNKGDKLFYRGNRHVLRFVSVNKTFLHDFPLQFKGKGGFGTSFNIELQLLRKELNSAFFTSASQQNQKLGLGQLKPDILTLAVFSFKISLRQSILADGSNGSLVCYVSDRRVPTHDRAKAGTIEVVNRKAGNGFNQLNQHLTYWEDLFIHKSCEAGQIILQEFEQYKTWGEVEPEPKPQASFSYNTHSLTMCDRNRLTQQSDTLIEELGWDKEEAQQYLIKNYRRRVRSQLTDAEFLRFVGELQQLVTEVFRDNNHFEPEIPFDD